MKLKKCKMTIKQAYSSALKAHCEWRRARCLRMIVLWPMYVCITPW